MLTVMPASKLQNAQSDASKQQNAGSKQQNAQSGGSKQQNAESGASEQQKVMAPTVCEIIQPMQELIWTSDGDVKARLSSNGLV